MVPVWHADRLPGARGPSGRRRRAPAGRAARRRQRERAVRCRTARCSSRSRSSTGSSSPYDKLTATEARRLLEPRHALRARVGLLPAGQRRGDRRSCATCSTTASRFLGLVRFAPHTGVTNPGYQSPGTDDVYGTNVARFLADNDQPDQLLLSLYGKLAAGMTREHVRLRRGLDDRPGQGPVLPLDAPAAEQRQQRLLPRDAAADARPRDHATRPARRKASSSRTRRRGPGSSRASRSRCGGLQTSFGPLTYTIDVGADAVHASSTCPRGFTGPLRLRLRLPDGQRIARGHRQRHSRGTRFAGPETIDLSGLSGHVDVLAVRR